MFIVELQNQNREVSFFEPSKHEFGTAQNKSLTVQKLVSNYSHSCC